jgi:hypothetical protein
MVGVAAGSVVLWLDGLRRLLTRRGIPTDNFLEVLMSAESTASARPTSRPARPARTVRLLGLLLVVAGVVLLVAGVATWIVVQNQLAAENITVSDDAERYAGDPVDGPLTAYQEAEVIEKHALEASGGKTYAEMERTDPERATVMDASFLRASLFTSVVSFGVAAFAAGMGVLVALIGWALMLVARSLAAIPRA